jgi:UDP-N-acetylenolpyruvoylglucosamine reductase
MAAKSIEAKVVESLRTSLRGKLIRPGDEAYETARKVYNAMIDRHPAIIVRPAGVADVISSVKFAREQSLDLSIRGGSHNVAGFGTNDDGLVIDLSSMRSTRVDPAKRTVRAEGGCTWGDLDHATHAFGLATTGGVISTTGVSGLTLGGGFGHLTRKLGLCCDNLLSADIVTADGQFRTASATENPDLFWALRGGGGNFGVVTSLGFKLYPVSTVIAGPIFFPIEKTAQALLLFNDYMKRAPEELQAFFAILIVPPGPPFPEHLHNKKVCGVICCYQGTQQEADKAVKPFTDFGPPLLTFVGPMPYPVLNTLFDALLPPGLHHYWKADYIRDHTPAVAEIHAKFGPQIPSVPSVIHIYPVNGAVKRVGKNDTAYSYRDAEFTHIIAAVFPDAAPMAEGKKWVRDYWSALHEHSAGGAYVNFMMADEGQERVAASYRDNYARLLEIKKKYDPTNLFHMNQNIRPVGEAASR